MTGDANGPKVALGLALAFLVLASCSEVKRHDMMTFFFDGVPPLTGELSDQGLYDPNLGLTPGRTPTGGWYVHEAVRNCADCHGPRQRTSFSRKVNLVAEVPRLCYTCHPGYSALEGWVHGPVATGDCLLCHEPHKTRNEFLLTEAVPELCFRCHSVEAVRSIENHSDASYSHCIDCHAGHASATRSLLNQAFLRGPAGAAYLSEIRTQRYDEARRKAADDLARSKDLLSLLRTAVEHVENGQFWQARAYLEVIANSGLLTEAEQSHVAGILQQVIALQKMESGEQAGPKPELRREELAAALQRTEDQRSERARSVAELYYRSIKLYHAGRLSEARQGFLEVLQSGGLLQPVRETAELYLKTIESTLMRDAEPTGVR